MKILLSVLVLLLLLVPAQAGPAELPEPMEVTVNGRDLGAAQPLLGEFWVPLEDFAQALEAPWFWKSPQGGIRWGDRWISLDWTQNQVILQDGVPHVPMEALCRTLGIGLLEDWEENRLYGTPGAGDWEIPPGYSVPVLMYHGITDDIWGMVDLFVSPGDLDAQLTWLEDNGFTTIFLEELRNLDRIEKPVVLTFDDGYRDNYTELFPILQKHGAKATCFVVTDPVDYNPNNMDRAMLREMSQSGLVSIQSHTVTHPDLAHSTRARQLRELYQSRLMLTRITGKEPYALSYPMGRRNRDTLELTTCYYKLGIDMDGGRYLTGTHDPYRIPRHFIPRSMSIYDFAWTVQ